MRVTVMPDIRRGSWGEALAVALSLPPHPLPKADRGAGYQPKAQHSTRAQVEL